MSGLKDIARVLLCVMALLALFEAGMRIAQVHHQASLYMPDDVRGYALRPFSHGWDVEENPTYVQINSAGMRDREHSELRPADTVRIAVIGDSMAEARQVPLDKTFESVMERHLADCAPAGKKVEVLNFAVPGYSLAQNLLMLRGTVRKYDPQIVILAMSMATAVTKNIRELEGGNTHGSPVFELVDGKLNLDAQTLARPALNLRALYWKNVTSDWMNASELLLLLNEVRISLRDRMQEIRAMPPGRRVAAHAPTADPSAPPSNYPSTWPYLGPANPLLRKAWDVTDALLLAMRDECAAVHTEFWIVTLDMGGQVHPDLAERAKLARQLGVASLQIADERVAAFAEAHRIHHIMLAPVTADYSARNHVALHGFPGGTFNGGHWNEIGHRVAGERIAREFCKSWEQGGSEGGPRVSAPKGSQPH